MKTLLFCSLALCMGTTAVAQVGGISASKLNTINTQTVPKDAIEFEPSVLLAGSGNVWNSEGRKSSKPEDSDSLAFYSDLGFRFTYGLGNKLEIGLNVPVLLYDASLGAKLLLIDRSVFAMAALLGVNFRGLNTAFSKEEGLPADFLYYATGMAYSFQLGKHSGIDFDTQFQTNFKGDSLNSSTGFFNADFGYYIKDGLQLVSGLNYIYSVRKNIRSELLILNPGITIESARHFILVISAPFSIYGRNIDSFVSFSMALTIMLD